MLNFFQLRPEWKIHVHVWTAWIRNCSYWKTWSVHIQRVEWQRNEHIKTILHDTICPVYHCQVCVCDLLYTRVNGVFMKPLSHVLGNWGSNWLENVWNVNLTRGINYYFQKECLESLLNEDISIWRHSDKCILVLKQYIYAKIKSIGI